MRFVGRLVAAVVAIAAVLYLAAAGYLYVFQRDYVFKPGGTLASPAEKGLPDMQVVTIEARDRVALTGWYQPAKDGLPTVLYFHGNAGNISGRANRFAQIVASGYGVLAVSYRGYPGSGGRPSEKRLARDGRTIFDWLSQRAPVIVIHGESLGTGVAVQVAATREARALVLEAPYTAALDMARAAYPWIPTRFLMRDPFLSREYIKDVEEPVLIVHGTEDRVVPFAQGEELFKLAHEPKAMDVKTGAGHSDLWDYGLWADVLAFLAQTAPPVSIAPVAGG